MISPEYAAGFFDGEGCVNLTVSGRSRAVALRLMIVNTDMCILTAFQAQFGGHIQGKRVLKAGWKPFNALVLSGHNAADFLQVIAPFSRVKAAQIALALEFWNYKQQPKDVRCDYVTKGVGAFARLKPSVIAQEQGFKSRLHLLNRKGAA